MKSSSDTPTQPINPWNYKPWWCQPWSILLTGISIISGSWIIFKTIWLTVLVTLPISAWMGFFLLIWPQLVIAQMKESFQSGQD
jgi:hypothetical protein